MATRSKPEPSNIYSSTPSIHIPSKGTTEYNNININIIMFIDAEPINASQHLEPYSVFYPTMHAIPEREVGHYK